MMLFEVRFDICVVHVNYISKQRNIIDYGSEFRQFETTYSI